MRFARVHGAPDGYRGGGTAGDSYLAGSRHGGWELRCVQSVNLDGHTWTVSECYDDLTDALAAAAEGQ